MQSIVHKQYYKNTALISPGVVGSVGDVNLSVRLKHSSPDMPLRYDPTFSGKKESHFGSNVQNGQSKSYDSHGGPARVLDSNWQSGRSFKTNYGWVYQDLRTPDKRYEPMNAGTPGYSWYNKIATTLQAKRTGDKFLPLPGEYRLPGSEVPRGSQVPRVIDADTPPGIEYAQRLQPIVTPDVLQPIVFGGPTPQKMAQVPGRPPMIDTSVAPMLMQESPISA